MNVRWILFGLIGAAAVARADVAPSPGQGRALIPIVPQPAANRDPVALARRHPVIAKQLHDLRGDGQPGQSGGAGPGPDETAVQVALSGQCGFAGCSQSTLVAFTVRSRGANTMTRSVLALVNCPPIGECQVTPAEVKPTTPLAKPAQK